MSHPPSPEGLPLTPLSHAVLLALADRDRHGYGIIKEVERQTAGALKPGTGTLYAALHRLADEELIRESDRLPEPDEDQRRKYYRLTPEGRALVRAETLRLARLVALARDKELVTEEEAAALEGGG